MGLAKRLSRESIDEKRAVPSQATCMDINWKMDSPISIIDPGYYMSADFLAFGHLSIRIDDAARLIRMPACSAQPCATGGLEKYLGTLITAKAGSQIKDILTERRLSLSGIDAHLCAISELLLDQVQARLSQYGVIVEQFVVAGIEYSGLESVEHPLRADMVKSIDFTEAWQRDCATATKKARSSRKQQHVVAETDSAPTVAPHTTAVITDPLVASPFILGCRSRIGTASHASLSIAARSSFPMAGAMAMLEMMAVAGCIIQKAVS